jgi:uncharacterized protein (DUF58 family)
MKWSSRCRCQWSRSGMNNKSSFVVLLICGILLSGLLARNGQVLLLAVPFAVYLIIGILQCPTSMNIRAERTIDKKEVAAREAIHGRIVVENQGKPLANLRLADALPHSMSILDGHAEQRLALPGGEATELQYVVGAARGVYEWNSIHASASDPFGLFELQAEIPAHAEIHVRPEPMRLHPVPIKPRSTLHAPGPTAARLAGAGTDFWSIREYRAGDPLRRLNWRLSGRYPRQMFTNEYEGEEIADFGLILDARRLTNAHHAEEALFEASTRAAASLAETFIKQGNRVALLVFGENTSYLFPGYGKRQLNLVRRELAGATLGRSFSLKYLEYFPARVFPIRSVILVFSALDPRDGETYARLRALGYDVLLISPDPIDYIGRTLPDSEVNGLAVRAARLERIVQLKGLLKMGVGVIDWQVNQPLDNLLQSTARYITHRRNM